MKKNCVYVLAALLFSGVAFTACSSEDEVVNVAAEKVQTYSVNIPAARGIDADTRTLVWGDHSLKSEWATTDEIYVVKVDETDPNKKVDANTLSPDKAGSSANLVGELAGTYEKGDKLTLVLGFYKNGSSINRWLNYVYTKKDSEKNIYQKGTKETVEYFDYASATVEVTAVDGGKITTTPASFAPCQSIYRLSFTDGTNPVEASSVKISTPTTNRLVNTYNIVEGTETPFSGTSLDLYLDTPSSEIYVAMRMDESISKDDVISFEVEDEEGYIYTGTKTAPPYEIVNGKYYAGTVTLTKTGKQNTFKITPEDNYTLYNSGVYSITGDVTISGSKDMGSQQISFGNGVTVTFKELSLTGSSDLGAVINTYRYGNQTIILDGSNTLDNVYLFVTKVNNLTIKGTGSLERFKVNEDDLELFKNGTKDYDLGGEIFTAKIIYKDDLQFFDNEDGTYSIKKP